MLATPGCGVSEIDHIAGPIEPATYQNCIEARLAFELDGVLDESCSGMRGFQVPGMCIACACGESCNSDDDCTAPDGTDAVGVCVRHSCYLRCDEDKTCPEGMQCADDRDGSGGCACAWVSDDPFVCVESKFNTHDDPCLTIMDEAQCNQTMSANVDVRCMWVEAEVLSTGSTMCEVAAIQPRCLRVREGAGSCTGIDVCPDGSTRVLYQDLGAGTAELLAIDCSIELRSHPYSGHCDFTDEVAIPLACGCGCDA
jgi:hypothetical protein